MQDECADIVSGPIVKPPSGKKGQKRNQSSVPWRAEEMEGLGLHKDRKER